MVTALVARSNDLEEPATNLVPQIAKVIEILSMSDGCLMARMSGSGATCFGVYADEAAADAAAATIGHEQNSWWVSPAQMLGVGVVE